MFGSRFGSRSRRSAGRANKERLEQAFGPSSRGRGELDASAALTHLSLSLSLCFESSGQKTSLSAENGALDLF